MKALVAALLSGTSALIIWSLCGTWDDRLRFAFLLWTISFWGNLILFTVRAERGR